MAIVVVNYQDSFDVWRQKTNLLSSNSGDISLLNNNIKAIIVANGDPLNLVSAINATYKYINDNLRKLVIKSIAMS